MQQHYQDRCNYWSFYFNLKGAINLADKNLDFTHLSEDEKINGINITNIPQYIREKAYLTDFSETLAQMTEMTIQLGVNMGLSPEDALEWARKLQGIDAQLAQIENINERIADIITTPAENINEQEIIDARDGKVSLGENIRAVKSEVLNAKKNITGDGYTSLENRLKAIDSSLNLGLKHRTFDWERGAIDADGTAIGSPRIIRTAKFIMKDIIIKLKQTLTVRIFEYDINNKFLRILRTENTNQDILLRVGKNKKYKLHVYDETNTEDTLEKLTALVDLYEIDLKEHKKTEIVEVNELPVNRYKFDDLTVPINLFPFMNNMSNASYNLDGSATLKGNSFVNYFNKDFFSATSDFSHIEVKMKVKNISGVETFAYRLRDNSGKWIYGQNMYSLVKEDISDGVKTIRLPFRKHTIPTDFNFNGLDNVRFDLIAENDTEITILEMGFIRRKKGVVYMYFDDADRTQYDVAFPIMKKYRLRGTLGVMTKRLVENSPANLTLKELKEMEQVGWLVTGHGYNSSSLAKQTLSEARNEMRLTSEILRDYGFDFGSKCFIAPQTSWSDEVEKIAKEYFHLARTYSYSNTRIGRGPNERTQEFPQNNQLGQYTWLPYYQDSVEQWKGIIDSAIERGEEVSIAWHVFCESDNKPYYLNHNYWNTPEMFDEVCAYIRQKIDEGVLDCVTWEDTMLQSKNSKPIDLEGNKYMSSDDGKPVLVNLD